MTCCQTPAANLLPKMKLWKQLYICRRQRNELTPEKVTSHGPAWGCAPFPVPTFWATISEFPFQGIWYQWIELPLPLGFLCCLFGSFFWGGTLGLWHLFCNTFSLWLVFAFAAFWFLFLSWFLVFAITFFPARSCKAFSKRFMHFSNASGPLLSSIVASIHAKKKETKKIKTAKQHLISFPTLPELGPWWGGSSAESPQAPFPPLGSWPWKKPLANIWSHALDLVEDLALES